MKRYKLFVFAFLLATVVMTTSCGDDFLTANPTDKPQVGAPATEGTIQSSLASAYQILLFDSYADNNYNSVLLMSDLRSDDLFKGGGDANDQHFLYSLSQFSSSAAETLNGLWSIYFTGLARANNAIIACQNAVDIPEEKVAQYTAEAYFLRAYYVHLLWKFWGNIPFFEAPLDAPYMVPQLGADEIYQKIIADLEIACGEGMPMKVADADLGRANRAAALMLKARVVMYQKDQAKYAEVANDMAAIINSGNYSLMDDFDAMWLDENEFCGESIFESNQLPEGKTWTTGWQGYGTNFPAFISPSELKDPEEVFNGGWAFAPVRLSVYEMYEEGDLRRDASINDWREGNYYSKRFQDTGLFQRKYAARTNYNPPPGDQDLNYCNNLRIFRYAETLLNYVELVKMHGAPEVQGVNADECFDQIRRRAFGSDMSIAATTENIKSERHKEFLGEGMRFWDLVRWGDATSVLTENLPESNSVRTFEEWMQYLPIPQGEITRTLGTEFELKQNGNWR